MSFLSFTSSVCLKNLTLSDSGYNNILNLQEAMKKAEAEGSDDCPVKIKLVAPPLYVLTTHTLDKVCLCLVGFVPCFRAEIGLKYITVISLQIFLDHSDISFSD